MTLEKSPISVELETARHLGYLTHAVEECAKNLAALREDLKDHMKDEILTVKRQDAKISELQQLPIKLRGYFIGATVVLSGVVTVLDLYLKSL